MTESIVSNARLQSIGGRPATVALLLFSWLAWTANFRALTLPDEARYSTIAWAMLRSGDWLTPSLNGLPFFHKPPLYYWLAAIGQQLLGASVLAVRLPSLLGATAGCMALWQLARLRVGSQVALWTLLVLATTSLFYAGAQVASPDMLVDGCIAITIALLAESTLRAEEGRPNRRMVAAGWAAAALGVLAKGLIAWVIPGMVLVAWLLITGRARLGRTLISAFGLLIFVAIGAPWFIAMELLHPGFARYFFVHHHFERFVGSGFNSVRAWWFYLVALPLFTLPWFPWLLVSAWRSRLLSSSRENPLRALMWVWLIVVLLFFSIPQSKPVGYLEPALFPVAYLAADAICAAHSRGTLLPKIMVGIGAVICVAYIATSGLTYDLDNRKLARSLAALRRPGDPVVFVDAYYYDIPMYAELDQPVKVASDWQDPELASHDDWRRELVEAAAFVPAGGTSNLVDHRDALHPLCDHALWVVAPSGSPITEGAGDSFARIFESNHAVLWRVAPRKCQAYPHASKADE